MKTIHFLLATFLFISISVVSKAQSEQYLAAMKTNVQKLNTWTDAPQNLAATFERIAQAEKTQWLPYYYASYATLIQTYSLKTTEEKDKLIEHAQSLLDKASSLNPDLSEVAALQGFLYVTFLSSEPNGRGAEYSVKANETFDKAIALNAQNPRALYLKGITVKSTPDFFGGGKKPAKPILEKAVAAYNSYVPASEIYPTWGKDDCSKQLAACE
jgi:hypothetical protein